MPEPVLHPAPVSTTSRGWRTRKSASRRTASSAMAMVITRSAACYRGRMVTVRPVGGWAAKKLVRGLTRSIPFVGTAVVLAFLGHSIRRKGVVNGVLDSAIDAVPLVGACKTGLELFVTGDWFPDKATDPAAAASAPRKPRTRDRKSVV